MNHPALVVPLSWIAIWLRRLREQELPKVHRRWCAALCAEGLSGVPMIFFNVEADTPCHPSGIWPLCSAEAVPACFGGRVN